MAADATAGDERRGAAADPSTGQRTVRTFAAGWGITPRRIQIALGCLWILDAALQYQPAMFGRGLVNQMILPAAQGQPGPINWSMTTMGHFLLHDVAAWNFLIATVQLVIGVGLLFRRWVRPALVLMFAWCLGVWWFGEGFGQLLSGNASPLTGAPGAVLLYAAIGVLVWPRRESCGAAEPTGREGVESGRVARAGVQTSAAAQGPLGPAGALAVWSGFWLLSAVLWLLPANRAPDSVHDAISGMTSGQPAWYAHFLNSVAGHFGGVGGQTAWALAVVSLVIGLGPLLTSRPTAFLALGATLQLAMWVIGMGLGGIMTGMGTDPQTAPLVVLLAVSLLPAVVPARASAGAPVAALLRWNPAATGGALAALGAAVLLSATYPIAGSAATAASSSGGGGQASSGGSDSGGMSGMPGMSGTSSGSSRGSGVAAGMKDMTGMGGLGVQDPNWHYTGPPLPSQEATLLSRVTASADDGHQMQTPVCNAKPSASQLLGAMQYVQQTSAAVAKYKDLNTAISSGYVPITDTAYPVVHYLNFGYMQQKYVMDPDHVQSLVYAFTPYGPTLVAAMYLMPGTREQGPMPYGCLTQWHAHTNLCISPASREFVGFTPCALGTYNIRTPVMTHVWQVPVAGGPLAMDPSDLQVVEAATNAQLSGQAPMQYPLGNAPAQQGPPGTGF